MPEKPKLPIDSMTSKEAGEFREKYLSSSKKLKKKDLMEIARIFGVGNKSTGRVNCNEYHQHLDKCIEYYHPATMVVHRLLKEVSRYKNRLEVIRETSENK